MIYPYNQRARAVRHLFISRSVVLVMVALLTIGHSVVTLLTLGHPVVTLLTTCHSTDHFHQQLVIHSSLCWHWSLDDYITTGHSMITGAH